MKKLIDYFLEIQSIKDTKRYKPYDNIFHENVAAHSFLMIVMATKLIDELKLDLDFKKVIDLIIHHDFGEIGLEFDFAAVNTVTKQQKQHKEDVEERKINELSDKYGQKIKELNDEYSRPTTREGHFVKLIDKMESIIYIVKKGCEKIYNSDNERRVIATRGNDIVKNFPELILFWKELQALVKSEYLRVGYEWKPEYDFEQRNSK